MGLESIFERVGSLFHHPDKSQPVEKIPLWQKRLLSMQEEGALPEEQLLVLTSSLFTSSIDENQRNLIYGKIGQVFKAISRINIEELAKAGDPNAIMNLITQATTEHKGNHEAQVAAAAYYLRMGMRPLREKFFILEEYAKALGIDPYMTDQDNPNSNEA